MKNTVSLKENRELSRLYRSGKCIPADALVIYFKKNKLGINRLGITCTKKIGKAVVRNKVRRRIKESYREIEDRLVGATYDIIIVARVKAASSDYKKISSALRYLCNKASLFEKDEKNINQVN